jgi:FdrA protein
VTVTASSVRVLHDRYVDSVELLALVRQMVDADGVVYGTALMGTPANLEALDLRGFSQSDIGAATPNDLVLAVIARTDSLADTVLDDAERALAPKRSAKAGPDARELRSLHAALDEVPDANVAIISVPGAYAALETHKALAAGLDVLLFSDNVSVADEVALKDHAARAGRLVMGPGAGTARLGGCGLGFANAVAAGRIGVVAAAGTGAQEVMVLLDRWGEGVSQVIGVGGRDLSQDVGGRSARQAVRALDHDPNTDLVLLVSKPPAPEVARSVVSTCRTKPLVAALVGLAPGTPVPGNRPPGTGAVAATLEAGVAHVVRMRGGSPPSDWSAWRREVADSLDGLAPTRTTVRGLFSGGTLCYEALTLMQPLLGPVWSNTPLDARYRVPAPDGAHVCLDLGEEEYTKGRPHPMIDAEARLDVLAEEGARDDVAVVLLDVVLGHGSHPDPASVLAPACAAMATADGPRLVAYVLGTDSDPQGLTRQCAALRDSGCLIAPTAARAALAAAAIALRRPEIVEADLV